MNRIKLIPITSIVSTNVAASALSEYASGTTYATGNEVKVSFESDGTTAKFPVTEWVSTADGNTGNYPPDNLDKWSPKEPSGTANQHVMFDDYLNTQTENTTSIEVELDASNCNAVGLFNMQAKEVSFELTAYSEVKKSETINLASMPGANWASWLFDDVEHRKTLVWYFPRYASSGSPVLNITITYYTGEAAKCGMVALGAYRELGGTQYRPKIYIADYSKDEEDSIGRRTLVSGNYADRVNFRFTMKNEQVDVVKRILVDARGRASIWDCNNPASGYEALVVYGTIKDLDIIIQGPSVSECTMTARGVI